MSNCLYVGLSVCLLPYLTCASLLRTVFPSLYLYGKLSICLFVCCIIWPLLRSYRQSFRLSLFICMSNCLFTCLYVCFSVVLFDLCFAAMNSFSVSLFVCLIVYLYVCLLSYLTFTSLLWTVRPLVHFWTDSLFGFVKPWFLLPARCWSTSRHPRGRGAGWSPSACRPPSGWLGSRPILDGNNKEQSYTAGGPWYLYKMVA